MTAHQVAPGRRTRDSEKMGYGHTGGRVQHQISRRVRNAARRLEDLERTQVRKPPAPLRFACRAAGRRVGATGCWCRCGACRVPAGSPWTASTSPPPIGSW